MEENLTHTTGTSQHNQLKKQQEPIDTDEK
jgi:hypothetical protein